MGKTYLWRDQHGHTTFAATVKELCRKHGYARGTARRMYIDTDNGPMCIGYVVGKMWFERFTLAPVT